MKLDPDRDNKAFQTCDVSSHKLSQTPLSFSRSHSLSRTHTHALSLTPSLSLFLILLVTPVYPVTLSLLYLSVSPLSICVSQNLYSRISCTHSIFICLSVCFSFLSVPLCVSLFLSPLSFFSLVFYLSLSVFLFDSSSSITVSFSVSHFRTI
jgi:hypothetical protein